MCEQNNCSVPYGFCHCGCGEKTNPAPYNSSARGYVMGRAMRFLRGHACGRVGAWHEAWKSEDCGYHSPCWIWQRAFAKGYGVIRVKGTLTNAHRHLYEVEHGELPPSLVVDHLCRNTRCVNPAHMEAVTQTVNTQRSTTAKLDWRKVEAIRQSQESSVNLAAKYGVGHCAIRRVRQLKTWVPTE